MPRGGARNRSGPQADPNSGRSEARGFKLTALPSEGYRGEVPEYPLPVDDRPEVAHREDVVWTEAWRTPQACAWSMQSWRWPIVAEYCRLKAEIERGAPAAYTGQLHRYRDQLGLTPAGLKENGWAIATDEVGARRDEKAEAETAAPAVPPVRRLRAAP